MSEARSRTTTPRKAGGVHATATAVECGMSDQVEEDSRPRKRAVVRTHRKYKVGFLGVNTYVAEHLKREVKLVKLHHVVIMVLGV